MIRGGPDQEDASTLKLGEGMQRTRKKKRETFLVNLYSTIRI